MIFWKTKEDIYMGGLFMKMKKRKLQLFGCILLVAFILFLLTSASFATDINMNHIDPATNVAGNATDVENTNTQANTTSSNLPVSSSSTTVSNMLPESNLGLATILNILLITVGVILILLGIAVLIRLK